MKVAVSWSGGKDSCFSLHKASLDGFRIHCLLNMMNLDSKRSMSHGLDQRLLVAQAKAMGMPIIQREVTWDSYEREFKRAVAELKQKGVEGVVFGDIDLQEHRDWIERVCSELEVKPIMPLWGEEPEHILTSFVDSGFEAVVVTAKAEFFDQNWLGRRVDHKLIKELGALDIHICGENGEYHTFVTDGPLFQKRIDITDSRQELREGYWFLDILGYDMVAK